MSRITLVKKIKADGRPCRKCADVLKRLDRDGFSDRIDRVVIIDEREPAGEGWDLAQRFNVRQAPFFVVENEGVSHIYTVYLQLIRDVLKQRGDEHQANMDLFDLDTSLDFI